MKKLFMTAAVISAFALTANVAMAEHHKGGEHKGKGKMMERADTDGDGNISKSEFMAKHEAMFSKIDTDGNGVLSKEEMKAGHEKMHEKRKEMKEKRMEYKKSAE